MPILAGIRSREANVTTPALEETSQDDGSHLAGFGMVLALVSRGVESWRCSGKGEGSARWDRQKGGGGRLRGGKGKGGRPYRRVITRFGEVQL